MTTRWCFLYYEGQHKPVELTMGNVISGLRTRALLPNGAVTQISQISTHPTREACIAAQIEDETGYLRNLEQNLIDLSADIAASKQELAKLEAMR